MSDRDIDAEVKADLAMDRLEALEEELHQLRELISEIDVVGNQCSWGCGGKNTRLGFKHTDSCPLEKVMNLEEGVKSKARPHGTDWLMQTLEGDHGRPDIVDVVRDCPIAHEVQGATEVLQTLFTAAGYYD